MKSMLGWAIDGCVQTMVLLLYNRAGSVGLREALPG